MISDSLFQFLTELKHNNSRQWFLDNKERYEDEVREPLLDFIRGFEPELTRISPYFMAIASKSGGSLFRIHRDVRFSSDKSPYKTHASLHFRHENSKNVHCPGFYLHLDPCECFCGAGIWRPDREALLGIRQRILDKPQEWRAVAQSKVYQIRGESLKRAPKGFDPAHPLIEDLKRTDHVAVIPLSQDKITDPGFLERFSRHCRDFGPYVEFLCRAVGQPY